MRPQSCCFSVLGFGDHKAHQGSTDWRFRLDEFQGHVPGIWCSDNFAHDIEGFALSGNGKLDLSDIAIRQATRPPERDSSLTEVHAAGFESTPSCTENDISLERKADVAPTLLDHQAARGSKQAAQFGDAERLDNIKGNTRGIPLAHGGNVVVSGKHENRRGLI